MSEAKRRISYRPDIDAMRGIAVLAVFIYHLNEAWLPGGFAGVDIFFVISGYVVTGSLIGHSTETPWQQLSGFYLRRIRRILPNLLASVGVTSLGIALLVPPTETRGLFNSAVKALYGWSNNHFAAKATDYFGLDSNLNPLSHTWSLGVEEQFYLIFPLLLLLIGVSRKRALPILLGLSLASLGLSLWWTQEAPILAFFLMPSRFWELSAGSVLLLAQLRGFGGHLNRLWLCLGGYGLMLLAVLKTSAQQWFPAPGALVAVLATLLLLQAGYGATSQRFLPWRWLERALVACGLLSYSLYLWHWPVLVFLRWTWGIDRAWLYLVAIGLSFGLAWLAYVLIEQPVRRKPLPAPWQWGLALMALITTWNGIDTLGYKYKGKIFLGSSPEPVPENEIIGKSFICRNCRHPINKRQLFLVGDSHAEHFLPMLDRIASKYAFSILSSLKPACLPSAALTIDLMRKPYRECTKFSSEILRNIALNLRPGDIVIFSSWTNRQLGFIDAQGEASHALLWSGNRQISLSSARSLYVKELVDYAKLIKSRGGHLILIVDVVPLLRHPMICKSWNFGGGQMCTPSKSIAKRIHLDAASLLLEVTKSTGSAYVYDPNMHLFDNSHPSVESKNGSLNFSDMNHLSTSASLRLVPHFLQFLLDKKIVN